MLPLPAFPWDRLTPYADIARAHPDGAVDLSIGTPVDPTPTVVREALAAASDAPGYPTVAGLPELADAIRGWLRRRLGVTADAVLPTIGSKELVGLLPWLLDRPGPVLLPELAYPTYEVGAALAGREAVRVPLRDGLLDLSGVEGGALLWVNYPANPHGRMAPAEHLAEVVEWGRSTGTLVVADECYAEFGWTAAFSSALACGSDGVLAVHSLSKRSNLAGYRAGFVAGDAGVVRALLELRKHAGLIVPAPVQRAMIAALGDDEHVEQQRQRYAARRAVLAPALEAAGWRIEHSEGGLYLWAAHPAYGGWAAVELLARHGILVAPGEFYGSAAHVRVALTATDERVAAAASRLKELTA